MNPQQINPYGYGNNAPVTSADAEGLFAECTTCHGDGGVSQNLQSMAGSNTGSMAGSLVGVHGGWPAVQSSGGTSHWWRPSELANKVGKSIGRSANWGFKNAVFDYTQCAGADKSALGCTAQFAMLLPVAKIGKFAKVAKILEGSEEAAKTAPEVKGGLNLFKHKSDQALSDSGWRDGDYFLKNDWKGNVKDTWRGNSGLLRQEMRNGNPIFDSYVDGSRNLIPTGGFLNMERNVLINRGWTFNGPMGAWVP